METLSKLVWTLTIIASAAIISHGLKCYNCVNCIYPNSGSSVQCSAREVCIHTRTDFNRIPHITMRGCAKLPFNFNFCREAVMDGTVIRECYCNTDLCNGEEYPNNALTRAGGEGTKLGLTCYGCVLGDCNDNKLSQMQCSKGFDSCSTSVIEDEILGLPVLSKVCSSGLETGCVTSGANSVCVCKGSLCNGYGTTTFEVQQSIKGSDVMKVLKMLNREVQKMHFCRPNENTINVSLPTGVSLKFLVVLLIAWIIASYSVSGWVVYRKSINKGSASAGECNKTIHCSKVVDSCSTSVMEDEKLGLSVSLKTCSSGLETGCVTSGNNSLCVCKGNLCNNGTTTFELQEPRLGKGNSLSLPTGIIMRIFGALCVLSTIFSFCVRGYAAVCRKFTKKGSASGPKPDITFTSLPQA